MIETAILGLLTEGESHGYGIHRRLVEMGFWRVSFGSVYPALRRLRNAGAIEISEDTDHKGRKLYRLTDQGRTLLLTDLGDANSVDNSNAFRIRLTFLDLLGQQERLQSWFEGEMCSTSASKLLDSGWRPGNGLAMPRPKWNIERSPWNGTSNGSNL